MKTLLDFYYFLTYHTHHIHRHYNTSGYSGSGSNDSDTINGWAMVIFGILAVIAIVRHFKNK